MLTRGRTAATVGGLTASFAVLAGCGLLSGTDSGDAASTGAEAARPTESAPLAGVRGSLELGALSNFQCDVDADGQWGAQGRLTNSSDKSASYVVTVVVAGSDSARAAGLQQRVPDLPAGDSVKLDLQQLPAGSGDDLTCQVQVVRRS